MEEGDEQIDNIEEEEYDEEGQVKKPGKKKKELSDYEKIKIKQTNNRRNEKKSGSTPKNNRQKRL